jgi:hypothetical protein
MNIADFPKMCTANFQTMPNSKKRLMNNEEIFMRDNRRVFGFYADIRAYTGRRANKRRGVAYNNPYQRPARAYERGSVHIRLRAGSGRQCAYS